MERTARSRVIRGSPPRGAARGAPATSTGSSGASAWTAEAAAARAAAGGDRSESARAGPEPAPGAHRDAAPLRHPPTRVASGAPGPALGPALEALDGAGDGAGAALVVARLDRVTRSLLAWAELVERSRRRGWAIVVVAEGFDLSTDSGELTAALLASVAQYERRLSGARTREAMAAGKARGARYGRPIEHAPEARHIVGDMRAGAATLQAIADRLTAEGISIPRGGPWRTSNVDGILRSLRLDAEAAQTTAPRSSAGPPAAVEILGNEIATAAPPDRSTRRPVAGRERLRGGDGGVLPVRRGRLPLVVPAPAGDGAVGAQPTRMPRAGGDGGVLPVGAVPPARCRSCPSR